MSIQLILFVSVRYAKIGLSFFHSQMKKAATATAYNKIALIFIYTKYEPRWSLYPPKLPGITVIYLSKRFRKIAVIIKTG